jgi:hypothetical protein
MEGGRGRHFHLALTDFCLISGSGLHHQVGDMQPVRDELNLDVVSFLPAVISIGVA